MITAATYYLLICDDCGHAMEDREGDEVLFAASEEAHRAAADGEDGWTLHHERAVCPHCSRARACKAVGHLWQVPWGARDRVACRRCPARAARAEVEAPGRPVLLQPIVLRPRPGQFAFGGDPPPF
ncbi:hypothetical protein [Nocardiopsis halophila]|uniref:hypothetical protein n=1 Tax=Nocardiopsis halophila TaxID=141692 RepID=UPI0003492366|nr:hypothetical protein [Nocardiopsis halophila]